MSELRSKHIIRLMNLRENIDLRNQIEKIAKKSSI